ncbi:MAG: MFS transporter [Alistipes sp.]
MNQQSPNPLKWVPSVYFAMGMPFVFLSMAAVLLFSDMGVGDAKITFWTSLLILPWSLKPLWSPLLEMFKTKKFFLVGTQIITGASFALMAFSLPLPNFFTYSIALMGVIALSGSTHDIAGDGLYLSALDARTQAKYIGWQGAFYNLAKILTMGGLVTLAGVLSDHFGVIRAWMIVVGVCSAIMLLLAFYHMRVLPTGGAEHKTTNLRQAFAELKEIFLEFLHKKYIAFYIAFIILYRLGEGFALKVVPLFLKAPVSRHGLGLSTGDIGMVYGTFGVVAFILGSILAGYYISSFGLKKTLFSLCCVFNIPFVVYLMFALFQPSSLLVIGGGIVLEYFGFGFGFVGLTLFMMQQVAPGKHAMAHYAFASGIMNLGVMLPGMVSGYLSDLMGYRLFFLCVMLATIPAFLATWFVPFTHDDSKK